MPQEVVFLDVATFVGDTTRFLATVRDFAGNLSDPTSAGFIVYDQLKTVVASLSAVKDSTGQYHTDWPIPMNQVPGWYIVEFFGQFSPTDINRTRARFQIIFA